VGCSTAGKVYGWADPAFLCLLDLAVDDSVVVDFKSPVVVNLNDRKPVILPYMTEGVVIRGQGA